MDMDRFSQDKYTWVYRAKRISFLFLSTLATDAFFRQERPTIHLTTVTFFICPLA